MMMATKTIVGAVLSVGLAGSAILVVNNKISPAAVPPCYAATVEKCLAIGPGYDGGGATPTPTPPPTATPTPTPTPTPAPTPTPDLSFLNRTTWVTVGGADTDDNLNNIHDANNFITDSLVTAMGSFNDSKAAGDLWNNRLADQDCGAPAFNIQPLATLCASHPDDNCLTFLDKSEFGTVPGSDPTFRAMTVTTLLPGMSAQPYNPHHVARFDIFVNLGDDGGSPTACIGGSATGQKCLSTRDKYSTGSLPGIPKPSNVQPMTVNMIASHELGHVLLGPNHNSESQSIMSLAETMLPGRDYGIGINAANGAVINYWQYWAVGQPGGFLQQPLPSGELSGGGYPGDGVMAAAALACVSQGTPQ